MFNRINFEKELVGAQMTHAQLAKRLGITREIEMLRHIFGKDAVEGFLFA